MTTPVQPPSVPVIDGLVYFCDGDPAPLKQGGVTAANVTVTHMLADLAQTVSGLGRWHKTLNAPDSGWKLIRLAADIMAAREQGKVGLIMGWQNALPVGHDLDRVSAFHALGLRVMQLTYNEANLVGDGCLDERNAGLSRFGRALVAELNRVGMAIDLSHCGERTTIEAAQASSSPVLVTHANARALDEQPRNKSDAAIRAVAATGGVIGASIHGFLNWDGDPAHPPTLKNFVRHVQYLSELVGVEHVGIGTDFSAAADPAEVNAILAMSKDAYPETGGKYARAFGNSSASRYPKETPTPAQFPRILEALHNGGFNAAEVQAIAGGNFLRAFSAIWGG